MIFLTKKRDQTNSDFKNSEILLEITMAIYN